MNKYKVWYGERTEPIEEFTANNFAEALEWVKNRIHIETIF